MSKIIIHYIRSHRFLLHFCFWLLYLVSFTLIYSFGYSQYKIKVHIHFINLLVGLPSFMMASYITAYWIIPNFLMKNRFFLGALLGLLILSFASISDIVLSFLFLYNMTLDISFEKLPSIDLQLFLANIPWVSYPVVIFSTVKFVKNRYETRIEREEQLRKMAEYEHRKLLRQLNPHFLFNNLNSLYQLTLERSAMAPKMVEKLSEVFHYILHESQEKYVPLQKETGFIQNYLELEQLRYDGSLNIKQSIKGDFHGYYLVPMVLFNLVENALNNGTLRDVNPGCFEMEVCTANDSIQLKIKNSISGKDDMETIELLQKNLEEIDQNINKLYKSNYCLKSSIQSDTFVSFIEIKNLSLS